MTAYTKQFYSIGEVAQMLGVPIYTLRFWEKEFPMLNPNRTAKGTRKFTPTDIDMAKAIKSAVYDRGMKIDGAVEYLNKTYRRQPPRGLRVCKDKTTALRLLDEVADVSEDAHAISKIKSVQKWIAGIDD